jgi:1-acyl-sn-glycerol-3-phosphate acyltransferase
MNDFFCWLINTLILLITGAIFRIDKSDLPKVPSEGPLILAANHVGSLEVPMLFAHLRPRKVVGLVKVETWDSKFMGWLFNLWQAIPIRRGEADLEAIHNCLEVLKAGDMLAVSPEGTRSGHGRLQRGRPGIAMIALHAQTPILPIAHWGGVHFGKNFRRLRRTDFHFRVGKPFYLDAKGEKVNGKIRQEMADEIMSQIALLMPEEYRGEYANCDPPSQKYLRFV